jgi:surface protein
MRIEITKIKTLFLILSFWIGTVSLLEAQAPFITTWQTDNPGTSNSTSISIPTNSSYAYNYDVDWNNDGIFDELGIIGDITHDYGTAGNYQVAIRGIFPAIYFNANGDYNKITSIDQWGGFAWQTMNNAFSGCLNLSYTATDAPNLANVTDMSFMFYNTPSFNGDLSNWNVTNVTDMSYMFPFASSFNGDLSNWNVANVTNMSYMLTEASSFNGDLSNWNVANVTDMTLMLNNCGMPKENYDNTLISWAAQSVQSNVNLGASGLNYCNGETARNTLVNTYGWNIAGDALFCSPFITTWQTNNPGTSNSTSITIPTDPSYIYNYDVDWNNDGIFDDLGVTGNITHNYGTAGNYQVAIRGTFPNIYFSDEGDKEKITSIDQWGDIAWQTMNRAFFGCSNMIYTATDIPSLANVSNMSYVFSKASSFNGDLSNWNVSNVTNMYAMFNEATAFSGDLSNWDVSNLTNMSFMLYNCGMSQENYDNTLISWAAQSVQSNVNLGADGLTYCNGEAARNTLVNTYGWNITGDALDCPPLGCMIADNVTPICTDAPALFPAALNQTAASIDNPNINYGSLSTTTNPAWHYLKIDATGTMAFDISNSANIDIDWIAWGPFTDLAEINASCGTGATPFDTPLSDDYTTAGSGVIDLGSVNAGEVYVVLVANYNNTATDITMSTTAASTANTDCSICSSCSSICEAPTNTQINVTSSTTATVTWDAVVGASSYQVKYRIKGTSNWTTTSSSSLQRNLTNLTKTKYYQYKVRANCASGWSDFSDIIVFYSSICDIVPTGIAAIYLDNARMRIRWDNINEVKAKVRYREVGTSTWYTQNSADGNNYVYINNLTPNATYQYRVRSNCEANDWSAYSGSYFHDLSGGGARMAAGESITNARIYPNPVNDILNVAFEMEMDKNINITISDQLGKIVHNSNASYQKGIQRESIDLGSFANGYYFITIQGDDIMETFKFVKIK